MQDEKKKKDFNITNGSKGKTQELKQKKNPAAGMDGCLPLVSVLCCQVEVSASG